MAIFKPFAFAYLLGLCVIFVRSDQLYLLHWRVRGYVSIIANGNIEVRVHRIDGAVLLDPLWGLEVTVSMALLGFENESWLLHMVLKYMHANMQYQIIIIPCLYYYLLSPQYTVLHILLLISSYFLPIFIYILLCYVSFFLHCPLSGPVLIYI